MKHLFYSLLASVFFFSTTHAESERRTDGPIGSEYGDFSLWDGELQVGAQFGALLNNEGDDHNFVLGLDVDYRPADPFGFRMSLLQGVNSPRVTDILLTPLGHFMYGNLTPYVLVGPGVSIVNFNNDTAAKFAIAFGGGADLWLFERMGLGLGYTYVALIDAVDHNLITARVAYKF